jgi:transcriptional antiterminator RfaH
MNIVQQSQPGLPDIYRSTSQTDFQLKDDAADLDCHNRNWCAVYTKARSENLAEVSLRQRGIVTFYPKLALPESAKRNRQLVPLFPNYLFVSLDLSSNEPGFVTWCPGVKRLLNFDGVPATIDNSAVSFLMDQATPDATINACSNLRPGQEVTIERGPLQGLIGIIETPPNARGRVKVLLLLLNRPTKVDVPVQFIKAEWVMPQS